MAATEQMNAQEEIDQLRLQSAHYDVSAAMMRMEAARDDAEAAKLRLEAAATAADAAAMDRGAAQMRYDREWKISNPPESTSTTSVRATTPTEKLTTLKASDPYP